MRGISRVSSSTRTGIVEPLGTPEERARIEETLAEAYASAHTGELLYSCILNDDVFAIVLLHGVEVYVKIDTRKEWIVTASIISNHPERVQPVLDAFMKGFRQ